MSTQPSVRLLLLGGAALEGERGPIGGRGAQRRRIALLSILAVARRGVSRDKLIGYLWEEADTERARRLLSESVYVVRKALGEDAILAAGDELRLNEAVVWCDVAGFSDAVAEGDLERAATLYNGPLLDGFFVSDALEFEQWTERERDRLSRELAGVLRRLAEGAETNGDFRTAENWWRSLCRTDPYAAGPALGFMRAADASGDRASALQHAAAHAARLLADFDAGPDPAVEAFARELRDAPVTSRPARVVAGRAAAVSEAAHVRPQSASAAAPRALAVPPEEKPPAQRLGTPRERVRIRRGLRVAIVGLLVTLIVYGIMRPSEPPVEAASDPGQLVIFPFTVYGPGTELSSIGLAHWVARNLDGAGDLRVVDMNVLLGALSVPSDSLSLGAALKTAISLRSRYFILSSITDTGTQVRLDAALYDTADVSRATHIESLAGPHDSIPRLMNDLSARLLAAFGATEAEQLRHAAVRTTDSFEALKDYWGGESHFLAGRYDRAVSDFTRATTRDPEFALAHYRLSLAAEWNFEFLRARRAAVDAIAAADRLSDNELSLLLGWNSFLRGEHEKAETHYGSVLVRQPGNVEALYGQAEVWAHYNPIRGEPARNAEPAFRNVLALVPAYGEARFHALEFAVRDRDLARFDTLFAQLDVRAGQHLAWRAVRAHMWGERAEQVTIATQLATSDEMTIAIAAARVAAHTHEFAAAGHIASLLAAPHRSRGWRAGAHIFMAQLRLAANDAAGARSELQLAEPLERDWTREMEALHLLHPFAAGSAPIAPSLERLGAWRPNAHTPGTTFFFSAHVGIHPQLRAYLLGLLSLEQGDTAAAESHRRDLLRLPGDAATRRVAGALATSLRGHVELALGRPGEALRHLLSDAARIESAPEFLALSPFHSRAHDRFTIAGLYHASGDRVEALRWYQSLLDGFDFIYVAPAHQKIAELIADDDPARAAWHAQEFERLTRR
ncbi:MAG TPA: BTAD domain-containing putative transcriptional regulator [Longimicrobiales bacterium]|nr:BTAD domain-containing putative transcriptional regulator [Longimicrobiales bacterium]